MELQDLLRVNLDIIPSQKDLTFDMNNATIDQWAIRLSGRNRLSWETETTLTQKAFWREFVRQMFADYNRTFNGV